MAVRFCASARVNPGFSARGAIASLPFVGEGVAEGKGMSNDLTPAEVRFVIALRGAGPLGTPPTGLARALGITPAAVGTLSYAIERKGYCTRERYGMRIFLRPTPQALALAQSASEGMMPPPNSAPRKRAPRTPGG